MRLLFGRRSRALCHVLVTLHARQCYGVSIIGLALVWLPDVHASPRDGEHEPLVLQEPDGPGDHVLAYAVGLLKRPVRRQRTIGPLTRGYPAAEDLR